MKGLNPADNFSRPVTAPDHTVAVGALMDWIEERIGAGTLTAVGHRVVHGGPKYSEPQRITAEMVEELRRLSPFDPDHLPEEILLTGAFHRRFPDLPQVACFDTAFHHDLPLWPGCCRSRAATKRRGFGGMGSTGCRMHFSWENWPAWPDQMRRKAGSSSPISATARALQRCMTDKASTRA